MSGPRPTPQTVTVSLRREMWTENPRGTYEVAVSITVAPDTAHTAAANLDVVHRLLKQRLDIFLDHDAGTASITPNGGTQ